MKKLLAMSIALMVCSMMAVSAQGPHPRKADKDRPSAEELMKEKWTFIVKEAGLDEKKAEIIHPFFTEYETDLLDLQRSKHEVYRRVKRMENATDSDYKMLNAKTLEFEVEKSRLFAEYFDKLNKQLSPKELTQYLHADRMFKQTLFGPRHNGKHAPRDGSCTNTCINK